MKTFLNISTYILFFYVIGAMIVFVSIASGSDGSSLIEQFYKPLFTLIF